MRLNLGAGQDIKDGEEWVNVDLLDLPGIQVVHNLNSYPWPFEDGSTVEIQALDVLEHLPNYTRDERPGVVAFVEECWRILVPQGRLFIQTPGSDATFLWEDPTHVRGFEITSMDFFDPDKPYGKSTGFYSKAKFDVHASQLQNRNLQFTMFKKTI